MPIVPAAYAKSKTLYALDPATFAVEPRFAADVPGRYSASVDALWTVTKGGVTQVSKGVLHSSFYQVKEAFTWDYFLAHFDTRYGGSPHVRWDGTYMWAPDTPLARMNELASELDPALAALPAVPAGYEGWFALKAR